MLRSTILPQGPISGTTPKLGRAASLRATGKINLQLVTDGTVDGTWKVLGSNKDGGDVIWDEEASDITAAFTQPGTSTSVETVDHSAPATQSQMVQAGPVYCAYVNVKFTPTAGSGNVSAFINEVAPTH
jgi:hypothetical protein